MNDWHFLFSSVPGNRHLHKVDLCQDYCDVCATEKYNICVICDGAGSSINSKFSSKKAVDLALNYFRIFTEKKLLPKLKISEKYWHNTCVNTFEKIRQDLIKHFNNWDINTLHTTIIVIIHLGDKLLIGHIGDGRAGYLNKSLEYSSIMEPYSNEYANETIFLTSQNWTKDNSDGKVRVKIIEDEIVAFWLMSDGCEKAAYICYEFDEISNSYSKSNKPYIPFFKNNITVDIPNIIDSNSDQIYLNSIWSDFLNNGNSVLQNEKDDKTMILAIYNSSAKCIK